MIYPDLDTVDAQWQGLPAGQVQPSLADRIGGAIAAPFKEAAQPDFLPRLGQNLAAQFQSGVENEPLFGRNAVMAQQYEPIMDAVNAGRPLTDRLPNPYVVSSLGAPLHLFFPAMPADIVQNSVRDLVWQRMDGLRRTNPGLVGNLPSSHADVEDLANYEQRSAQDYAGLVAQGSGGPIGGVLAPLAGQAAAGLSDPVNVLALGAGMPASQSLVRTFLQEGAVNAGFTLGTLPFEAANQRRLGRPMTASDGVTQVIGAGILGGGLGVGARLLERLWSPGGRFAPEVPPSVRAAATNMESGINLAEDNPFTDSDPGRDLHRQALLQTINALDDRRPDLVPDFSQGVEARARAAAPEAFAAFDAAGQESDALRTQIADLGARRSELAPAKGYQDTIDTILGKVNGVEAKLTKTAAARLDDARGRLDDFLTSDTPQMAFLRRRQQQSDFRMRDAGPAMAAALREARAVETPDVMAQHIAPSPDPEGPVQDRVTDAKENGQAVAPFSDPVGKPEAFRQQTESLSRELGPQPEKPSADGSSPEGVVAPAKPLLPFGDAQGPIEALRSLPQDAEFPGGALFGKGEAESITVKEAGDEIERRARAVERLRGCVED